MKVTISIPTCSVERLPSLVRTVESIQSGTYKDVHPVVIVDGSEQLYDQVRKRLKYVSILLNKKRIDWIASTNRVLSEFTSSYYIYAADDIFFPHNCIESALLTMQDKFPDGLGVVTLGRKPRCIFGLMGDKFINLFPRRQVFCPDYTHFCSDTELLHTVKKLELFAYPPNRESQVIHKRTKDITYLLSREVRDKDFQTRYERQDKGYLWGINFGRVRG